MSSRRVALSENPNAANSPRRSNLGVKRTRAVTEDDQNVEREQSPAKKKQLVDAGNNASRRPQPITADEREGKVFMGRTENASNNTFQRRLAAVFKDSKQVSSKATERVEKQTSADSESMRQWRKHYRKVFPSMVFYFESLPQDVCLRFSRQIAALGAHEEKFFSRAVTHIVTSRQIPPSQPDTDSSTSQSSRHASAQAQPTQTRTINPSLLEKQNDAQSALLQRGKGTMDLAHSKRTQGQTNEVEQRKSQTSNNADILVKARDLGIKIWTWEKFERMVNTLLDDDSDEHDAQNTRRHGELVAGPVKHQREADLSQLLREEKKTVAQPAWQDVIPLRGLFIYIHDMDERSRPVMLREYPKSAPEDGDWPQLRSVPMPRCPFLDEIPVKQQLQEKKEKEKAKEKEKQNVTNEKAAPAKKEQTQASKNLAVPKDLQEAQCQGGSGTKQALRESENAQNRVLKPAMPAPPQAKTFEPPKLKPSVSNNTDSLPPYLSHGRFNLAGMSRNPGREPTASGVNPSNVTSAIRSQMISSTAAAPGAKAGTSKELHQLQRKAIERRSGLSTTSIGSSYMNEVRAAVNTEQQPPQTRTLRRRPVEALGKIQEDEADPNGEEGKLPTKGAQAPKKKQPKRKEPKPGYCENCVEKYEDFTEHVQSRKHRKFALTTENFTELDDLLKKLTRPVKDIRLSNRP